MRKNRWAAVGLVLLLLGAAGCGGSAEEAGQDKPKADTPSAPDQGAEGPAGPEPDLSDVPAVVARVNGEPIRRAEFTDAYTAQLQQAAAQPGGAQAQVDQEKLRKQTLDTLVGTALLRQEGDRLQIDASSRDVDRELTGLAQQNGMKSPDQLVSALKQQGLTEKQVRDQVRDQVIINEVIAQEAGNTTPSRAEVRQLYDQLVAQQEKAGGAGGQVPPFKQVEPQLAQQVKSQKESTAAQQLVARLRSDAEITINL